MIPFKILKEFEEITRDRCRDLYCRIKGYDRPTLEKMLYELKNPPKKVEND